MKTGHGCRKAPRHWERVHADQQRLKTGRELPSTVMAQLESGFGASCRDFDERAADAKAAGNPVDRAAAEKDGSSESAHPLLNS